MQDEGFYDAIAGAAARRHGIPVSWIKGVIGAETSFQIPAPNRWEPTVNEYAYGPMQILLSTARGLFPGIRAAELEQPETNIDVGAAYLREIRDRYGDDFRNVYSAYNSGNPDRWKTSDQVRSNVERAAAWLQKFVGEAGAAMTGAENAGVLAGAAVLALVLFWKRRKK